MEISGSRMSATNDAPLAQDSVQHEGRGMNLPTPRPHVAVFHHTSRNHQSGAILAFGPEEGQSIIMEHEEARYLLHKLIEVLLMTTPRPGEAA